MEVSVNLRNPAQFFACCGIASLLDADARFEFEEHAGSPAYYGTRFACEGDFQTLLIDLRNATYESVREECGVLYIPPKLKEDSPTKKPTETTPVRATIGDKAVLLSWWLTPDWRKASELKTLDGTMTPLNMLRQYSGMMKEDTGFLTSFYERGGFGFDTLATGIGGGVAGALSPVTLRPVTEILCAVGLQFVRPIRQRSQGDGDSFFTYHAWRDELPPQLTWLVGSEGLEGVRTVAFQMRRDKKHFHPAEFLK